MDTQEILNLIEKVKTSKPFVKNTLDEFENSEQVIKQSLSEISRCIDHFNLDSYDEKIFINASHTKSLIEGALPSLQNTLSLLYKSSDTRATVLTHLITSKYLNDVWKEENPVNLINNILILLYRTTLLETDSKLKRGKAQISSTLEEMSLLLALMHEETLLYEATKHWMQDWEEEGFSEELSRVQSEFERIEALKT